MMVTSLAPGAPAEQAGVLPGDILLDVDGNPARRARALAAALGPERIGQAVTLRLLRAGALHAVTATVARPTRHNAHASESRSAVSAPLGSLRVTLLATDPVRRHGLAAMLQAAGHSVVEDAPDVVLCDLETGSAPPREAEAPVLALADQAIDAARRAAARGGPRHAGPRAARRRGRPAGPRPRRRSRARRVPGRAEDAPPLTPREAEVLALVGQGMSNKAVARRLGISLHTVKFHLEALFEKLGASSRAQAVAIGLRGGAIEL